MTSNLVSSVLTDCEASIGNLLPYNGPRASIIPIPNKKPGKLDDIRFNGWLDAMKSSSPTSKRLFIRDSSVENVVEDLDLAHCAWTVCVFFQIFSSIGLIKDVFFSSCEIVNLL